MTVWKRQMVRGSLVLALALAGACGDDDEGSPADGSAGDGAADGSASDGSDADGSADGSAADGAGDGSAADGSAADGSADGSTGDGAADGSPDSPDFDACLADAESRDSNTERLVFSGEGLRVAIVRYVDPDAFGTSGTTVWLPALFAVADQTGVACISDSAALGYEISHHNFDDAMAGTAGAATFTLTQKRVDYGFPAVYALTKKQGDQTAYGPSTLTLESCTVLNDDSDCRPRYEQ